MVPSLCENRIYRLAGVGGWRSQEDGTAAKTGGNGYVSDPGVWWKKTRQRKNQLGMIPHVQSDSIHINHARNGKRPLASCREKKSDATKRARVRLMAARTKGAHLWVSWQACRRTIEPEHWRETKGRCLGSNDTVERLLIGGRCCATGYREGATKINKFLRRMVHAQHLCHIYVRIATENDVPRD